MDILQYVTEKRRALHRLAELSGGEVKTQAYICAELSRLGVKHKRIGTAVIADIPGHNKGFRLALRCDMDALPIQEDADHDYLSQTPDVMHACGHDGHTAMVLCAAALMAENKPKTSVRLIFQPAEESGGGAEALIEAGALKDVDAILGLHLSPDYNAGEIAVDAGAVLAGVIEFDIELTGKSGHCAKPADSVDAIAAVMEFYSRSKRMFAERFSKYCLYHVGKISGGYARNIVADAALLQCTFRYFDRAHLEDFTLRLEECMIAAAEPIRAEHRFTVSSAYPPLVNSAEVVNIVKNRVQTVPMTPQFTAEDFAFYLEKIPGCLCWLGVRDENHTAQLHNSRFDFDERALVAGVEFYRKFLYSE